MGEVFHFLGAPLVIVMLSMFYEHSGFFCHARNAFHFWYCSDKYLKNNIIYALELDFWVGIKWCNLNYLRLG